MAKEQKFFWFRNETEPEPHTKESIFEYYPPGSPEAKEVGCRCIGATKDTPYRINPGCIIHVKAWA